MQYFPFCHHSSKMIRSENIVDKLQEINNSNQIKSNQVKASKQVRERESNLLISGHCHILHSINWQILIKTKKTQLK